MVRAAGTRLSASTPAVPLAYRLHPCPSRKLHTAMNPNDETTALRAELAELRKETTALRREMNALRRFITIEFDEDTGEPFNINIRCACILFAHPAVPGRSQMFIGAGPQGPGIGLWDSTEKCRVFLGVENDDPLISLYTAERKDAVLLRADPADGRGIVAVLDNGNPRALMKAGTDNAGVVSVVHDDGMTRVTMHGTEDVGSLMVASLDMQAAVKLTSQSLHGGGTLTVNGPNGKPSVILGYNGCLGGAVLVNDPDGKIIASLPGAGFGKKDDDGEEEG